MNVTRAYVKCNRCGYTEESPLNQETTNFVSGVSIPSFLYQNTNYHLCKHCHTLFCHDMQKVGSILRENNWKM